jgi:hypothetical protein
LCRIRHVRYVLTSSDILLCSVYSVFHWGMCMGLACKIHAILDAGGHEYRVLTPDEATDWLREIAKEYVHLRTCCVVPLRDISLDGIGVVSTAALQKRLQKATIPIRRADNFDVVRSDFGEVICYMLLEQDYGVKLGYKSVRDRETINCPGRGIDAVGFEDGEILTVVLGETKVSDAVATPPEVVDKSDDSLSKQHVAHLTERDQTAAKLWETARHVTDPELRDQYIRAAILLEEGRLDKLRITGCCALVRSIEKYQAGDFGSFRKKPKKYQPEQLRFLIVCTPEGIETIIGKWYEIVKELEVAA